MVDGMISVTKSILIGGSFEMNYIVSNDGSSYISVFAKDPMNPNENDDPLMYLYKDEAKAIGRALLDLANS